MNIREELLRMQSDKQYVARTYAKIFNFEGDLVPLVANEAQAMIYSVMDRYRKIMAIKGRKMGSTTGVAFDYWHEAQFNPGRKVLVAAHRKESAEEIFRIYKTFASNMPDWFKAIEDYAVVNVSKDMIEFGHGGRIVCVSADSEAARGSTSQLVHMSEFCWYRNIDRTMGAIMGSVPENARVFRESTANGMNHGFRLWNQKDGYYKLFLAWTMDNRYSSKTKPRGGPIPLYWKEYAATYGLTKQQLWWAVKIWRNTFGSNTALFHQEFPATAELAFQTSGNRMFTKSFPQWSINKTNLPKYLGKRTYHAPRKYGLYVMGVDTASGSQTGDFSTWHITEVSDPEKPVTVSTYYGRVMPNPFAEMVLQEAKAYGALVVIEINGGYGTTVLNHLVDKGYSLLYMRKAFDKIGRKWVDKMGWHTNTQSRRLALTALHTLVESGSLEVVDPRLGAEINTFADINGKLQAQEGEHDDMIMATAIMTQGFDQVGRLEDAILRERPVGTRQILEWELRTGKLYSQYENDFYDREPYEFSEERGDVLQNILAP